MLGLSFSILGPDYAWPYKPIPLATSMPKTPRPTHWILRRFWGYVHKVLIRFSRVYCRWTGVAWNNRINDLPFGLVLKWSDGTRVEEALTMQITRAAGLPVPKVICYGEHANSDHAPVSILMTRMPGDTLFKELWEWYLPDQRATIISELKNYFGTMRHWPSPWEPPGRICSVSGGSIRSVRVPKQFIGPYETEKEFNNYLMAPAWHCPDRPEGYWKERQAAANKLHSKPHQIVFTHGDINPGNILLHEGHVSAILDWESAGWYPDYWDYTTGWRLTPESNWYYHFIKDLADGNYVEERKGDLALRALTGSSIAGW